MDVVRACRLFAFARKALGLVVAPLAADGPREQSGNRREVALLAEPAESLVSGSELSLGGDRMRARSTRS